MNGAHLHLVVNHLPIIIPMIGALVMLGGFVFSSAIVKRTAYAIFILGAVATLPAFFTGEGAEEIVEDIQSGAGRYIHEHEEAAEVFAILSYLLGLLSIVGLWANVKQKAFANMLAIVTLAFSVAVLYFAKQTGTTGGEIRHIEIREGGVDANAPKPIPNPYSPNVPEGTKDNDHDGDED